MINADKTYLLKQNEALFEATLNEFSSKPYDLASTNVIIKNSDYNKGSFYYRFKTKEDIYIALIDYVYTLGVASLNSCNLNLNNLTKEEELIDILFSNLKSIYNFDKRYFKLLKRINYESKTLKVVIDDNCIESSLSRILKRLNDVLVQQGYQYLDIFQNSLNSLMYNHFDNFNNVDSELTGIKQFLFNKPLNKRIEPDIKKLKLPKLKGNLNYVITDYSNNDLSVYNDFRLSQQLTDRQSTLKTIRDKLKIKQVTLENIINSAVKKSLRDLSFFIELKSLEFAKTSYHLLEYSEQIALLLVYNSFIGKEYILIDQLIVNYKPKELEILFNQILPKTAKISKIVVVNKTIYPNFIDNFYIYLNNNDGIEEIEASILTKKANSYLINYFEGNLLKTRRFRDSDAEIMSFLTNKKIKNITSDYSLEYKDILKYRSE